MLRWLKCSRNHMKKNLRNWLLTVCVRLKTKQLTMMWTLRNILWCPCMVFPHQSGLSGCFRWWLVNPVSASDTRNRRILPDWCSKYRVHSVWVRICHSISEYVQPGTTLHQRWTWSQRTRRSTGNNAVGGSINTKLPTCDDKGVSINWKSGSNLDQLEEWIKEKPISYISNQW